MADDTHHPLARPRSRLEPAERLVAPPEEDQDPLSLRSQLRLRLLKSKRSKDRCHGNYKSKGLQNQG